MIDFNDTDAGSNPAASTSFKRPNAAPQADFTVSRCLVLSRELPTHYPRQGPGRQTAPASLYGGRPGCRFRFARRTVEKIGLVLVLTAGIGMYLLLSGCATTTAGKTAQAGVHADHATTAYGLGVMGATELNPLAPLGPLRYWAVRHAEGMRCEDGQTILRTASTAAWGATGWNVLMLAAGPAPAVLGGVMGALGGYQSAGCEAVPASPAQLAVLDRWEAVYEAGDAAAMRELLTDAELAEQYADLFRRTERRDVAYRDVESVRDGMVARFKARLAYTDGTEKVIDGDMRFKLDGERVREAGRI